MSHFHFLHLVGTICGSSTIHQTTVATLRYFCSSIGCPSISTSNIGCISLLELFRGGRVDKHPLFVSPLSGSWNATNLSLTCSLHSAISSSTSNKGDLEDSANPTTIRVLFLPLRCISKSFSLLVHSFTNSASLMWQNTSEGADSEGLVARLRLLLGNAALSCCPSMHPSHINEDIVQGFLLKFMSLSCFTFGCASLQCSSSRARFSSTIAPNPSHPLHPPS